jgi:hypothetical protein
MRNLKDKGVVGNLYISLSSTVMTRVRPRLGCGRSDGCTGATCAATAGQAHPGGARGIRASGELTYNSNQLALQVSFRIVVTSKHFR